MKGHTLEQHPAPLTPSTTSDEIVIDIQAKNCKALTEKAGDTLAAGFGLTGTVAFIELSRELVTANVSDPASQVILTTLLGFCDTTASGLKNVDVVLKTVKEFREYRKYWRSKKGFVEFLNRFPFVFSGGVSAASITAITFNVFTNPAAAIAFSFFTGFTRVMMNEGSLKAKWADIKWWQRIIQDENFRKREEISAFLNEFKSRIEQMGTNGTSEIVNSLNNNTAATLIEKLINAAHRYLVPFNPIELTSKETTIKMLSNSFGTLGSPLYYAGNSIAMEAVFGATGYINMVLSVIATLPTASLQGGAMQHTVNAFRKLKNCKNVSWEDILYTIIALGSANPLYPIAQKGKLGFATYPCAGVATIGVTGVNRPALEKYAHKYLFKPKEKTYSNDQIILFEKIHEALLDVKMISHSQLDEMNKLCRNPARSELNEIVVELAADHKATVLQMKAS